MEAFKQALADEYGGLGTHAFDTILGHRSQFSRSLRACDVKATLSALAQIRLQRVIGELNRQLDISPKMMGISLEMNKLVRAKISAAPFENIQLAELKTADDITAAAAKRIEAAISAVCNEKQNFKLAKLGPRKYVEDTIKPDTPVGLLNKSILFEAGSNSLEDRVKSGEIGPGMRVNRSATNPVIFEKLKTNGVEPGFICRYDWSIDDTHGFMQDINSEESRAALENLKQNDENLARQCEGKPLREQIMLAGRAHPAGMAAVAEFALIVAAGIAKAGNLYGGHPFSALARALKRHFARDNDIATLASGAFSTKSAKSILEKAKTELFAQIRDAVLGVKPGDDFYSLSPIFKHFSDRHIVKLDYNENDRIVNYSVASQGTFMRPERILTTRPPVIGSIYRLQSAESADKISAGAVTEALANDLGRLAGVPSQELQIVRGQYSDGHPKIMLEAKFADGYKDLEAGLIKDGRVVSPDGRKLESLGKYKAFFLLTADRDAVGRHGQNKGFANGRFFAIDPGHSLEGNSKYLEIADDFSFTDTYGASIKPRFDNFSVFDDDTRFAKLQGLVKLRNLVVSNEFHKLFEDYRAAFDPKASGISEKEKALRKMIVADIDAKEAEFNFSMERLLKVGDAQLKLYDALANDGEAVQKGAIETVSNLEKLTSPTTWTSKKGKVALEHLEVKQGARTPWKAFADGSNIVYVCDKPLAGETIAMLQALAGSAGAKFEYDNYGCTRLVIPADARERAFAVFSEEKVAQLTHPDEYVARKSGMDSLAVAKDYSPAKYAAVRNPAAPVAASALPAELDVESEGKVVKIPKAYYESMATTKSALSRPRSVDELRASLGARIRRGFDIVRALQSGNVNLFEATQANIAAFTLALHIAALQKGKVMKSGSFSIEDREGNIARWLDSCKDVYIRNLEHASQY